MVVVVLFLTQAFTCHVSHVTCHMSRAIAAYYVGIYYILLEYSTLYVLPRTRVDYVSMYIHS